MTSTTSTPRTCPACGADHTVTTWTGRYCLSCGHRFGGNATSDYPALTGDPVTERHARTCRESGHATHTVDGVDTGTCPRCGAVTAPAEPAAVCRECGRPGRYTVDGVTLCTAHRGLLGKYLPAAPAEPAEPAAVCWCGAAATYVVDVDPAVTNPTTTASDGSPAVTVCTAHAANMSGGYEPIPGAVDVPDTGAPWWVTVTRTDDTTGAVLPPFVLGPFPDQDTAAAVANDDAGDVYTLMTSDAVACGYTVDDVTYFARVAEPAGERVPAADQDRH